MKATALEITLEPKLRRSAEQRLRAKSFGGGSPQLRDLRFAAEELRVYGAELQIQNEELLDSRAQIEESHKKYFRHFDLAPVGLVRLSYNAMILEANMLGAQMLDMNRALLRKGPRPFLAHVAPQSVVIFEQHLESARFSDKMEMCELSLRGAAGRQSFVRMQSVVSRNESEQPEFYITLTDLTEHRDTQRKLEQQKVLAEAAVATKELFLATLSHELRTPLTPILALLEDLSATQHQRSAEDLAAFAVMQRNLELETRLIDDLLDVTRISSGKLQLHLEPIDANLCLRQAIEICQAEVDSKGLQLSFEPAAARHFVNGDASRLHQVCWNLIKNSVKFTPSGGRISIKTRCGDAQHVIFEFCDTGIGIDSFPLGHIFDPFFQAQNSPKHRIGGLGLGLAICKAIAEAHGGTLSVASDGLGKGTTFRLELPTIAEPRSGLSALAPEAAAPARREGLRILLAEDHDDTRLVLARLLRRRGYDVEVARDAQEARELAGGKTFDLLVSDIALPDATGCELLGQLNAKYGLHGIAMSGFGSDADLAQSKEAGFLEHLVKPIDATKLDTAIQLLIENHRLGRLHSPISQEDTKP